MDLYRGHTPVSFVYIGGEIVQCERYDLNVSNKGDVGNANVTIPLDNIASEVFAEGSVLDNIFEVEIWSGYLQDHIPHDRQIAELKRQIETNEPQRKMTRRFSGFVAQPEWQFGLQIGKYFNASCLDWTALLREYKYPINFEGGACEINNIVKEIAKLVQGLKIVVQPYSGSVRLGEISGPDNDRKLVYNSSGKTYYEILEDCAKKLGYKIILEGKTIELARNKKSPFIWQMYWGPEDKVLDSEGNPRGQFFDNLRFRYDQKGRVSKADIVIECLGSSKKKQIKVVFPEDLAITNLTKYKRIVVPGECTKEKLRIIAEFEYKKLADRVMTGNLDLEYANPFIFPYDLLEFVVDESDKDLKFMHEKIFSICAYSESYSIDGYSQQVEFEADSTAEKTIKKRIAPRYD